MSKERLKEIAKWAQEDGFQALEVDHSHIDIERLDGERAKRTRELFENCSLEISSLGYHCNNLDPSHLYWLGVDYIKAVRDFKDGIFHVHAKDTEILGDELAKVSIRGRGWWWAAIPG